MSSGPAARQAALAVAVVCLVVLCGCTSAGPTIATAPIPTSTPTLSPSTPSVTPTSGVLVVPDMSERPADEAAAELRRAGFAVSFYDEEGWADSPSDPAFRTVASQYPREGNRWPVGATVKLGLAIPDGMASVPDVEGLMDADVLIRTAGLKPVTIAVHGPVDSDAAGIGKAYRQRPRPGTVVKRGTKVTYRSWWESQ